MYVSVMPILNVTQGLSPLKKKPVKHVNFSPEGLAGGVDDVERKARSNTHSNTHPDTCASASGSGSDVKSAAAGAGDEKSVDEKSVDAKSVVDSREKSVDKKNIDEWREKNDTWVNWQRTDKYKLLSLLGCGSYGEVALAVNLETGEKVAIKRLEGVFNVRSMGSGFTHTHI